MTTTNFATARDVTTALSSLGFQPSVETIQTISRNCREQFLNHLSKCITGQDAEGNSKKVIGSLLRCLSPDALNRLNQITPNVTADRIVPVALKAPTKLLSAIEAASNPEHERHIDAKSFLTSVFSPVDQEEAAPAEEETAADPNTLPRNETLYSNGQQWGAVVGWNPYSSSNNNATATIGLQKILHHSTAAGHNRPPKVPATRNFTPVMSTVQVMRCASTQPNGMASQA